MKLFNIVIDYGDQKLNKKKSIKRNRNENRRKEKGLLMIAGNNY